MSISERKERQSVLRRASFACERVLSTITRTRTSPWPAARKRMMPIGGERQTASDDKKGGQYAGNRAGHTHSSKLDADDPHEANDPSDASHPSDPLLLATSHEVEPPPEDGGTASAFTAMLSAMLAVLTALVRAAVGVIATATQSEVVHWLGHSLVQGCRAVGSAVGSYLLIGGRALLRCSLSLAADTAPKVLQAAPVYAKALLAIAIARPDLTGAAIGALGLLHYAWRALLWWRRRREARRASLAAEVDAAARWVLVELREHAQRWQSVSGSMSAPPLPPSELRARVPHAILSNRSMWKGVASRVRSDESVRVVPAGSFPLSGSERPSAEEGWIFSPSSGPLSPGYASPPGYTSPVHRRHTSPGRPAPVR